MNINRIDKKLFYAGWRQEFKGVNLTQKRVDAIDQLLTFIDSDSFLVCREQIAYVLATTFHETNKTMLPIKEIRQGSTNTAARAKRRKNQDRYWLECFGSVCGYYGRGYVMITWLANYMKLGMALVEEDWTREDWDNDWLAKDPNQALTPEIAYDIMSIGMRQGLFTGKKLDDYIKGDKCDFKGARRIVNGTDRKAMIAGYAKKFSKIISNASVEEVSIVDDAVPDQEQLVDDILPDQEQWVSEIYRDMTAILTRVIALEMQRDSVYTKMKTWFNR